MKLLRSPGESLRRKIHAFDEESILQFLLCLAFPPLAVLLSLLLIRALPQAVQGAGIAVSFGLGLLALLGASLWITATLRKRQNHLLGYWGERAVAEALTPFLAQGYRVFHDLPAQARDREINIDHVVVGPHGIAVIETKTRRRGSARPGYQTDEVRYDGHTFIWPWGEDQYGLDQVDAEAVWLGQWIETNTGIRLSPKPIIVFPGWRVDATGSSRVSVASLASLPKLVVAGTASTLTPEQIDLIARLLDEHSRTVED